MEEGKDYVEMGEMGEKEEVGEDSYGQRLLRDLVETGEVARVQIHRREEAEKVRIRHEEEKGAEKAQIHHEGETKEEVGKVLSRHEEAGKEEVLGDLVQILHEEGRREEEKDG